MYKSPIEIVFPEYGNLFKEVQRKNEEEIMTCIQVETGIKIDKEELIRALRYDRDQYAKGYADGKRSKQSHWIDNAGMYTCAHCGSEFGVMMNYCGGCGYRMDGDPDDA